MALFPRWNAGCWNQFISFILLSKRKECRRGVQKKKKKKRNKPFFLLESYKCKSGVIPNSFWSSFEMGDGAFLPQSEAPFGKPLIWFSVSLENGFSSLPYRLFSRASACLFSKMRFHEWKGLEAFRVSPFDQHWLCKHHGGREPQRDLSSSPQNLFVEYFSAGNPRCAGKVLNICKQDIIEGQLFGTVPSLGLK